MLADARKETFASNLSAVGLDVSWDQMKTQSHFDELEETLSSPGVADESRNEVVFYNVCGDMLPWNAPKRTTSMQINPQLHTRFKAPSSFGVYVVSCDFTNTWSPGNVRSSKMRTNDGCTSLRSGFVRTFLMDYAERCFGSPVPSTSEYPADPAVSEPQKEAVEWIKAVTGLSWDRVGRLVGVTRPAINAWRQSGPIRDDHRQRLFAVRDVLERAAKKHSRPSELAMWLDTPRGVDARTPANLLEAGEIGRARLLAVASSSSKVKTPPSWAQRDSLEAYQYSRERVRALPPERDEDLLAEMSDEE